MFSEQVILKMHFPITEPYKMNFYDVRDSYFDGYRTVMNPFFKDPAGKICNYTEMKKRAVYHTPFYNDADRNSVGEEARKFIMYSNADWQKTDKYVRNLGQTPVQVKIFYVK